MKLKRGSNQYIYRHKLGLKPEVKRDCLVLIILMLLATLAGREYQHAHPILSPCPDSGCISISKVQAAEPKPTPIPPEPTAENIIAYITKVFKPEGTGVVVKAISCFYSESGLRANAYNFNTNQTEDKGVAQINSIHGLGDRAYDFMTNIDKAYQIYKSRGNNFSAWYGRGCK